ncbi:response regulator [Paenibacillus sp. GCM10027627]|uniref:response regulator transcription factor n=1 Tax=unclassified Paenibacillus TaxID=185978 RepID=UPI003634F9EB
MKLKAMLVDDELPILNNLRVALPWEELGIEVAALARNGKEALDYFHDERPDLVLCDIRMPVMDGMAFLAEVRKTDTDCEMVMLTGYQEFEYAREALKRGVRDYILKPIDYEQLEQSVRQISEKIRTRKQDRKLADERWGRMASMAYEQHLYHLLLGFDAEQEWELLADQGFMLTHMSYCMLLVDIDSYAQLSAQWSDAERKGRNAEMTKSLRSASLAERLPCSVLQLREGEWCILVQHDAELEGMAVGQAEHGIFVDDRRSGVGSGVYWNSKLAEERLLLLREAIADLLPMKASVIAYPKRVGMRELSSVYKKLQHSLLQASGDGHLYADPKAGEGGQGAGESLWQAMDAIVASLRKMDQNAMQRALARLKSNCLSQHEQAYVCSEKILHYLLIHLLREMREMQMVSTQEEDRVWRKLQHSVSMKDMMGAISQLMEEAMEKAFSKKSSEMLMIAAKDYILKRLTTDLGVEELAGHLGISGSYFSMLFKNHFGETFVEYVTSQRMKLAQSLLLTTDKTVTEIGTVSGYAERRYFTKVFQKYYGMTPSECRERGER